MGKSFDGLPAAPWPGQSDVSALRWPRATVPSVMERAERPSAKKSLGRRGTYFGWSCMSWRQADSRTRDNASKPIAPLRARLRSEPRPSGSDATAFLVRNFRYLPGLQRLQELARFLPIEERIGGFDAQEETVAAGQCEARHVERRVVGHGQAAQTKHAENRGQRRKVNGHFERDDDVGGPTVQRPSADIDGIVHHRDEVLQHVAQGSAHDAADQHQERQLVLVQVQSVAQLFDGEGRIGVEFPVALFARRPGGVDQRGGVVEFGHHAVDGLSHPRESSLILACGKSVRTSKIEIIGRRRMNSINRTRNSPMVPRYVAQSQRVDSKTRHEEGRLSCARLATMITKRSSHMPTSTISDQTKSTTVLLRTFLNHRALGAITLQAMSTQ